MKPRRKTQRTLASLVLVAMIVSMLAGISLPATAASDRLPSDVLDLTNWKLTLPIDKAKEITQPSLDNYEHSDYFHINSEGNGVVFMAPVEGETTSGSGYPRSELREMTNNGKDKASWSTSSGTHIMEITQKITHLPDVKQHVVVGQIHDADDDVIVFRLEGSKLFIDENGKDGPVLTENYKLGTTFTVKFVAGNGGVMCYYNGEYVYTYSVKASGCYFKAGMYTQSNLSKGDKAGAYGECVIYDVKVTHLDSSPRDASYYEGIGTDVPGGDDEVTVPDEDVNTTPDASESATEFDMSKATITVSGYDTKNKCPGSNAVDGKTSTRWAASDSDYSWIKFDLKSVCNVTGVKIAFHEGKLRYTPIKIKVSTDNKNWKVVYDGHSTEKTLELIDFDFSTVEARYVMIEGYGYTYYDGSKTGNWTSITEVQVMVQEGN